MGTLNDLTGKKIGYWEVLYRNGSNKSHAAVWRCKCTICENEYDVSGTSLQYGNTTKCRKCSYTHNARVKKQHRRERIDDIYKAMKNRCYNQNSENYKNYGGRGITICDEWLNNKDTFFEWSFKNGYSDKMTIERIDNNKGYSPSNCKWITHDEQAKNKRNCVKIIYNGIEYNTINEACKVANLNYDCVSARRRRDGISSQEAFDILLETSRRTKTKQ